MGVQELADGAAPAGGSVHLAAGAASDLHTTGAVGCAEVSDLGSVPT